MGSGSSHCGSAVTNSTSMLKEWSSIPGLTQRVKDPTFPWAVGHRCGSDLALLCLWCRSEGTAPIQPPAWELSYATGLEPKKKKKKMWVPLPPLRSVESESGMVWLTRVTLLRNNLYEYKLPMHCFSRFCLWIRTFSIMSLAERRNLRPLPRHWIGIIKNK